MPLSGLNFSALNEQVDYHLFETSGVCEHWCLLEVEDRATLIAPRSGMSGASGGRPGHIGHVDLLTLQPEPGGVRGGQHGEVVDEAGKAFGLVGDRAKCFGPEVGNPHRDCIDLSPDNGQWGAQFVSYVGYQGLAGGSPPRSSPAAMASNAWPSSPISS